MQSHIHFHANLTFLNPLARKLKQNETCKLELNKANFHAKATPPMRTYNHTETNIADPISLSSKLAHGLDTPRMQSQTMLDTQWPLTMHSRAKVETCG